RHPRLPLFPYPTLFRSLLAWMLTRCHEEERSRYFVWLLAVWLILITHVVLDALTVYGTQLLWPVWPEPISWGTIFIIDPAYTLPDRKSTRLNSSHVKIS